MTTVHRLTDPPGQIRRRVTGTPAEVAATVALVRQSGRYLSCTTPRQLDPADPRVTVIVTLHAPTPTRPVRRTRRRWVKPTVIAATSAAALAAAGYGLVQLAHAVARQASTHASTIAGALLLIGVVLILAALARGKVCTGLHCTGCRRH